MQEEGEEEGEAEGEGGDEPSEEEHEEEDEDDEAWEDLLHTKTGQLRSLLADLNELNGQVHADDEKRSAASFTRGACPTRRR